MLGVVAEGPSQDLEWPFFFERERMYLPSGGATLEFQLRGPHYHQGRIQGAWA